MRKYVFLNWKCHPLNWQQTLSLAKPWKQKSLQGKYCFVVSAPFIFLEKLNKTLKLSVCGQDCFWKEKTGPYLGAISASMLKTIGCKYVFIGHSERRIIFKEEQKTTVEKLAAAFKANLKPLLFFGETKYDSDKEMISGLNGVLRRFRKKDLAKILFVYEPCFAISTQGHQKVRPARLRDKTSRIKSFLNKQYGLIKPLVLYGGSVDSRSLVQYLTVTDGVVIGQASLQPLKLIKALKG